MGKTEMNELTGNAKISQCVDFDEGRTGRSIWSTQSCILTLVLAYRKNTRRRTKHLHWCWVSSGDLNFYIHRFPNSGIRYSGHRKATTTKLLDSSAFSAAGDLNFHIRRFPNAGIRYSGRPGDRSPSPIMSSTFTITPQASQVSQRLTAISLEFIWNISSPSFTSYTLKHFKVQSCWVPPALLEGLP